MKLSSRVFQLASAILAASDGIPVESAILIAIKFVWLMSEIEKYKHEAQIHHDH